MEGKRELGKEAQVPKCDKISVDRRILVVYYSRGGNTRAVARALSNRMGSDIDEIGVKPLEAASSQESKDPKEYDLVIVRTPVNGFTVSKPITKYLERNRGSFCELATFATYSLWPAGTLTKIGRLADKEPIASMTFRSREIKLNQIDEKLEDFVDSIEGSLRLKSHEVSGEDMAYEITGLNGEIYPCQEG